MADSVAIMSGGLDSTTMVYRLVAEGYEPQLLSFDYGQRHRKELEYAEATAEKLNLPWSKVDLTNITGLISTSHSTLVDLDTEIPEGHYAEENMKQTVVPNRNMIMLSIAVGVAVAKGAEFVAFGAHTGDHFIYPDCRPQFLDVLGMAARIGNEGFGNLRRAASPRDFDTFYAPFIDASKADIARQALVLNVPFEETWSCYKGGAIHCGRCGTCVERLEAIDDAVRSMGVDSPQPLYTIGGQWPDKTEYEDAEFWKSVKAP